MDHETIAIVVVGGLALLVCVSIFGGIHLMEYKDRKQKALRKERKKEKKRLKKLALADSQ